MNLLELPASLSHAPGKPALAAGSASDDSFREIVGQLGREIGAPLTSALERVAAFATSGRIDRAGLAALRNEIECARRLGLQAQQFGRYASGRERQLPERVSLTDLVREALIRRSGEAASRGIELHQELMPVEVIIDASMGAALLQTLLDWCLTHARSHIGFRIDKTHWPEHGRLTCRFAPAPVDRSQAAARAPLDTVAWQLLRRLAHSLGLALTREHDADAVHLTLEFPRTVGEGAALLKLDEMDSGPPSSQPSTGRHVLVVASRRETRHALRETLRATGLMVDYVASVDEARDFCSHALPHAVVFEAALAGDNFRRQRAQWSRQVPSLAFIEIVEQGREVEVCELAGQRTARVGRDAIASGLPGALMFELSRAD